MMKLECLQEVSIWLTPTKRELYEDGFGYIYEVDDAKATKLLAMRTQADQPCFRRV